jgi:hypothetical protein
MNIFGFDEIKRMIKPTKKLDGLRSLRLVWWCK